MDRKRHAIKYAAKLCEALFDLIESWENDDDPEEHSLFEEWFRLLIKKCKTPESFTLLVAFREHGGMDETERYGAICVSSPLQLAIRFPGLALPILDAGALPESSPEGGATLLRDVINGSHRGDFPSQVALFRSLLARGADPCGDVVLHEGKKTKRFRLLPRCFRLEPARGKTFLKILLDLPCRDGDIALALEGAPPWGARILLKHLRWRGLRCAWVAAVLRALPV